MDQSKTTPFIVWFATLYKIGFCPIAPGTLGALFGFCIWLLLVYFHINRSAIFVITLLIIIIGFFVSRKAILFFNNNDPKQVIIDETAGYLLTMALAPLYIANFKLIFIQAIVGFGLFRFFDIVKPWPVSYFDEKVKGASGVMLDDIVAGIMSSIALWMYYFAFYK